MWCPTSLLECNAIKAQFDVMPMHALHQLHCCCDLSSSSPTWQEDHIQSAWNLPVTVHSNVWTFACSDLIDFVLSQMHSTYRKPASPCASRPQLSIPKTKGKFLDLKLQNQTPFTVKGVVLVTTPLRWIQKEATNLKLVWETNFILAGPTNTLGQRGTTSVVLANIKLVGDTNNLLAASNQPYRGRL
jgi:hypothetical protein